MRPFMDRIFEIGAGTPRAGSSSSEEAELRVDFERVSASGLRRGRVAVESFRVNCFLSGLEACGPAALCQACGLTSRLFACHLAKRACAARSKHEAMQSSACSDAPT